MGKSVTTQDDNVAGVTGIEVPTTGVQPHSMCDTQVTALITGYPGLSVMAETLEEELNLRVRTAKVPTKEQIENALKLVVDLRVMQVNGKRLPKDLDPKEIVYPACLLPLVSAIGRVVVDDGVFTIQPSAPFLEDKTARAKWDSEFDDSYKVLREIVRLARVSDVALELAMALPKSRYGNVDFYAFQQEAVELTSDSASRDAVLAVLHTILELRLSEWIWASAAYSYGKIDVIRRNLTTLTSATFRG